MITLNKESGVASDIGQIWRGTKAEPAEEPINVVVNMSLEDDDQVCFDWDETFGNTMLYVPLERLRALLRK